MKKRFILIIVLFASMFLITGCSSKSKDKQVIIETKSETEKVIAEIFSYRDNLSSILQSPKEINSNNFEAEFLAYGHDMLIDLDEKYNKGTKVIMKYTASETEDDMIIGEDKSDSKKYHIYIGSETYKKLWSYATIDLDTGKVTWQDNF